MLNFTVGPVMSDPEIIEVANHSAPYFRTPEFSKIMLQNEKIMLEFLNAPINSRCVFFTTSGTGAMESCVMNILNKQDKVIVINGGSFGQRFVELCELHSIQHTIVKCDFGHQIRSEQLQILSNQGYTALLINMNETSSGTLYDMEMISAFCKQNNILLIVDAISAFLSDNVDMDKIGAAAVITGSQKALSVQPGVSIIALTPQAITRINSNPEKCLYLSLKQALKNMERGQTPFTPAVTTLLQINARLNCICNSGGVLKESKKIRSLADDFRNGIKNLPLDLVSESPANAVTALRTRNNSAQEIIRILKDEYQIWACPNGGEIGKSVLRIGHIGFIRREDNDFLLKSLYEIYERGVF